MVYQGMGPSKNTYSGWSKRATRGYCSHEWDEDVSRGSTQTRVFNPRPGPIYPPPYAVCGPSPVIGTSTGFLLVMSDE